MTTNPIKLIGTWDEGFALDVHTISSTAVGEDVYGHMQYNTTRSDMGELLYGFKYKGKYGNLEKIIELSKPFITMWEALKNIDIILPAPSSNKNRMYQPACEIASEIATYLNVPFSDGILQKTTSDEFKNLSLEEKQNLKGTIIATKKANRHYSVLIVDDLYKSGSTLNECVSALKQDAYINKIFVLTMTKTR